MDPFMQVALCPWEAQQLILETFQTLSWAGGPPAGCQASVACERCTPEQCTPV